MVTPSDPENAELRPLASAARLSDKARLAALLGRVETGSLEAYVQRLIPVWDQRISRLVVTANPEIMMNALRDPTDEAILSHPDTDIVADGIGVVLTARRLQPTVQKIPGIVLAQALLAAADAAKRRVFLYGAKPEVMADLKRILELKHPGIQWVGALPGYGQSDEQVIEQLVAAQPQLVLVALGAPRQERVLAQVLPKLKGAIGVGVGGSFDVLSGHKRRAPKFWQRLQLEWLWRLLCEPKRIGRFLRGQIPYLRYAWRLRQP